MIKSMITGAGSVLGQSIFKSLSMSDLNLDILFCNSDEFAAGFHFNGAINQIIPLANDPNYLNKIATIVEENNIQIIFPGTQHELEILSKYATNNPIVACFPYELIDLAIDKIKTMHMLSINGIVVPLTTSIEEIDQQKPPIVIKPNKSSASRNIIIHKNNESLNCLKNKENYLVQEYISGDEYTCGCYIDKYTKSISSIIIKRLLNRDGASGYGEVVENQAINEYLDSICKAYIKSGLEFGHLNVQLKLCNEVPYCFEINGRLSSTEAPKASLGFNSVEAYIYNIVLKRPYDKFKPKIGGKFIRYYEEIYF